jgi:hypothetical protein
MDSGTDWLQVVIVPAIVAGVVALAIEYAAKPALEARKERVLRTQRSLWELRDGLITLTDRLDTLDYWIRSGDIDVAAVERDIHSVREELRRVEALGADSLRNVTVCDLGRVFICRRATPRHVRNTLASVRSLPNDEQAAAYQLTFRSIGANFTIPREYLSLPRRSWIRRRRLVRRAAKRDEWRERLPDHEEEHRQARMNELAGAMILRLGEQESLRLLDVLQTPGKQWVSALGDSAHRSIVFACWLTSTPTMTGLDSSSSRSCDELSRHRMPTRDLRLIEIAALLGVSKQRAHQIAAKSDFPAPIGQDRRGRLWSRGDDDVGEAVAR